MSIVGISGRTIEQTYFEIFRRGTFGMPKPNTVRVSLEMSEELNRKLEEMAESTHNTKSELLRKALALMEVAIQARRSGKKIGIAEQDQPLLTEIIGIGI